MASEAVLAWFGRHAFEPMLISEWTLVEVASALALKVRTRQLTAEQAHAARSQVDAWAKESFERLPVERDAFRTAATLLERTGTTLRAGEALHLAIALTNGAALVTNDRAFAAEAEAIGIVVELPTRGRR